MRPPHRQPPTPTVPVGLARLTLDVDRLNGEVRLLKGYLKVLGPVPQRRYEEPLEDRRDYSRSETGGTVEPENKIKAALEDTEGQEDPAAQMRVIRAISANVDGALTDIRAIRTMFEDIVQQPEVLAQVRERIRKKRR
jgi:hypothetical protein